MAPRVGISGMHSNRSREFTWFFGGIWYISSQLKKIARRIFLQYISQFMSEVDNISLLPPY